MITRQLIEATMTQVRDTAAPGCLSPLNSRGEFTSDQVRAALVRATGQIVDGAEVSKVLRSNFPSTSTKGYHWIVN